MSSTGALAPGPLIVCADLPRVDELVRLVAAAGVDADVAADLGAVRRAWATAPIVIVGDDATRALIDARLTRRRGVVVVGSDLDDATVWQRAVALGAEHVVFLPDAAAWLVGQVVDAVSTAPRGVTVGVVGGHGGAGATTLAAALAVTAHRLGHSAVLVDADPLGGGIDVALAAEAAPGARWPDLLALGAARAVDVVPGALPTVYGVPLLSWDRGEHVDPPAGSVPDVVDAARRSAPFVVVDVPRAAADHLADACVAVDTLLLVTTGELRAVAAAARVGALVAGRVGDVRLVVRGTSLALATDVVASALGLPLAGRLRSDRRLSVELPVAVATGARTHLGRTAVRLVRDLLDGRHDERRVDAA